MNKYHWVFALLLFSLVIGFDYYGMKDFHNLIAAFGAGYFVFGAISSIRNS